MDQTLCVAVVNKLLDVLRKIQLFDQRAMLAIKIISCIEEAIGETADQLISILKVAGKSNSSRACGDIAIKVFMLCKKLLHFRLLL
jgi:hypothetical protein